MGLYNPPIKGNAFTFTVALQDMNNPGSYAVNPSISAGEALISKDNGAFANLANLPTITPTGDIGVLISLTATEMAADSVIIKLVSLTSPKPWADFFLDILTA